ncbi:hypothetical protein [Puniceicoccus vermicola]|uniref:Glycoside hydrolase family 5 domain-containing protein n=1 Tax=Puniceicoccus vermicola TaxID=388746 RepID=A0A7X1E3Z9_9BACT|nr:hypothetical protein [Puniceicoccus vermicola]MBC2601504.1 hypothetical protein [Puniceicoccus vermicola]
MFHKINRFCLIAVLCSWGAALLPAGVKAPEFDIPSFTLAQNGVIALDGISIGVGHYDLDWNHVWQNNLEADPDSLVWEESQKAFVIKGSLVTKGGGEPLLVEEKVWPVGSRDFDASYTVSHSDGLPTNDLSLRVYLPLPVAAGRLVRIDGKGYELPAEYDESALFYIKEGMHVVELPTQKGTLVIEGKFGVIGTDQKPSKFRRYSVRLNFFNEEDALKSASISVKVRYVPFRSEPVDMRAAVNRALVDEVASDGKGGWTDQGPENDLSPLEPGEVTASNVVFEVIDAEQNQDRAALVFANEQQPDLPSSALVSVPGNPIWRNLYLLHAAAWTAPSGTLNGEIVIRYLDGSETRHKIKSGDDVGNWWAPVSYANSVVAWVGENESKRVGLFVSRFPLDEKPIDTISLVSTGASMWMIVGMSGSPDDIPIGEIKIPLELKAGNDWGAYEHELEIEKGSVFDFSDSLDAPAGKFGYVVPTEEGHLAFEDRPNERVRFWGINLCFTANFLTHEESDKLANRIARSGYNVVRLHHFDAHLSAKQEDSSILDPVRLDEIDYLVAALKKRGIYVNIDLYSTRRFSEEELVSFGIDPSISQSRTREPYKALVAISEEAFQSWASYADNLLLHRNPYTGLTWAEEPAIISMCPINEVVIERILPYNNAVREQFEMRFEDWLQTPEGIATVDPDAGEGERDAAFRQWIYETEGKMNVRLENYLRSIGVKSMLTGTNHMNVQGLTFLREDYDIVDNHHYWDHPQFPKTRWRLPYAFHQKSVLSEEVRTPRYLMATRVPGIPFSVSEVNFVRPNQFRAEGGVLMPAYASLQDWDAIYNFEYAMNQRHAIDGGVDSVFSLSNDPIGLLADRISAVLFRREYIASAPGLITYAVQPEEAFSETRKEFSNDFTRLGLVTRIGSLPGSPQEVLEQTESLAVVTGMGDEKPPVYLSNPNLDQELQQGGVLPEGSISPRGEFKSETDQIRLDTKKLTASVIAPKCELFVLPARTRSEGEIVSVVNGDAFATISLIAVDDEELAESRRLLLMHLTDGLPTGMRFEDEDRTVLTDWGRLPYLIHQGATEVLLRLPANVDYSVWAVDATGRRTHEIPMNRTSEGWRITLKTVTSEGVQLAYEIVRNEG